MKTLRALVFTCLTLSTLAVSTPVTYAAEAVNRADTLKTYVSSPIQSLDPIYVKGKSAHAVSRLVHSGLVGYSPKILPPRKGAYHQIVPAIASSWQVGSDKKSYIFRLNPEARFQNGRQVTAEDVKYSFERAANPNLNVADSWALERLGIIGLKRYQAARRAGLQEPHLLGVEVIDHDIVQIQLDRPIPYALELLALPLFSIVPRETVQIWWEDFGKKPMGAGPYQVTAFDKNQVHLKKVNTAHNSSEVENAAIQVQVIPSEKEQFMAFTQQKIDHAPVPETYLKKVLNDPRWNPLGTEKARQAMRLNNLSLSRVVKTPRWESQYISMNNQRFPFTEPKVRQAFNYAVDKQAMIQNDLKSYGVPMTGIFPPGFPGGTRTQPLYEQDLDKARTLLFEAGWRDKDYDGDIEPWQNPRLNLVLHYHNEVPESYAICQRIQADLAKIGVTVKLAPLRDFQQSNPGQLPSFFHMATAPEILDPSQLFYPTFSASSRYNTSGYQGELGTSTPGMMGAPKVQELISQAEDLTYEPRRYELYQEAERLIIEDAPWLFLFHPVDYQIVQPRVNVFAVHPQLPLAYEQMSLQTRTARQ